MLNSLYEYEKTINNIHDGIREYCKAEKVNEEYLRSSMYEKERRDKPSKKAFIGCISTRMLKALGTLFKPY
ncbi:MAG TPA: hypothetical protein PLF05_02860 [Thermoclostridium sp.]|nr:hypothetical protein [Thermoclostridium sp.]